MTYTNSPLATAEILSPFCTANRVGPIKGVAIHCTAGNTKHTAAQIAAEFQKPGKKASCNYAVGGDGSIALVVPERSRSWCTSSAQVDDYAVTIEVASDPSGLVVRDEAVKSLVRLLADICLRNNIPELKFTGKKADACKWDVQNMQCHRWFSDKACPGSYLFGLHPQIASQVNALIKQGAVKFEVTEEQIKIIAEKVFTTRIAHMTDEELETLIARVRLHESKKECPPWAKIAWGKAKDAGLLDGSRPVGPLKRDEFALVLDRLHLLDEEG